MKIIYTVHAIERMHQRNITKDQVELCIQNPDRLENLENSYKCIKRIDNQLLVVIYKKLEEKIIIITAFKTSKTKKYL